MQRPVAATVITDGSSPVATSLTQHTQSVAPHTGGAGVGGGGSSSGLFGVNGGSGGAVGGVGGGSMVVDSGAGISAASVRNNGSSGLSQSPGMMRRVSKGSPNHGKWES